MKMSQDNRMFSPFRNYSLQTKHRVGEKYMRVNAFSEYVEVLI